jgi:hypothetical protein
MYTPYSDDISDRWAEDGYRRTDVDSFAPDNPVALFAGYYRSLAQDDFPDWDRFDVCDVPSAVVPYIALAGC